MNDTTVIAVGKRSKSFTVEISAVACGRHFVCEPLQMRYKYIWLEGMGMCLEWHDTTREIGGWRHDNEPVARVVLSPYANSRGKTRWCLLWCFVLNCVHAPPARAPTAISQWKPDSWRQSGSVKTSKKSRTVTQCGYVTLNFVHMASKQAKVAFSSHIFQFTRLHGVAVVQGLMNVNT